MKNTRSRHRVALAVASLLLGLAAPSGRAAVSVTGSYSVTNGNGLPIGPGDVDQPGATLQVGWGAPGSFAATAGAKVTLAYLTMAGHGSGTTSGLLEGAGTVLTLKADGNSNRFAVGNTGSSSFVVSQGARLDAATDSAACNTGWGWCNNIIGAAAGSNGLLTVTGAGSEASLIRSTFIGHLGVNQGAGHAGQHAIGGVLVADGATLNTGYVVGGGGAAGAPLNGTEYGVGELQVTGAGSRWLVTDVASPAGAFVDLAQGTRSVAQLDVLDGGTFRITGSAGRNYGLRVGAGGDAHVLVRGANALLWLDGDADQGFLHIAEGARYGEVTVESGGRIGGGRWVQVGLNGGNGRMIVTGGSADFSRADVQVGNNATGLAIVGAGGRLDARQVNLGTGSLGATGSLTVEGAGSVLTLRGVDTHRMSVGAQGSGTLTVRDGALLDASGDAAACAGHWCGSFVGQLAGSTAHFTVTGAGSEARFLGDLTVGDTVVARPAIEGWTGGELNGATRARVDVLAGGRLSTEGVNVGGWSYGGSQGGGERSFSDLVISGAGSTWLVAPDSLANRDANLNLARSRGAVTTLDIADGGLLRLQAASGHNASADLTAGRYGPGDPTAGGGSSVTTVRDAGSRFEINGDTSRLVVGNNAGGTALLRVLDGGAVAQNGSSWSYLNIGETSATGRVEILSGGQVSGARSVNVGSGGDGSLLISGASSLLTTDRNGSFVGQLNVGQQGQGRLDVLNGGAASVFSLQVGNGFDHAGTWGQVVIDGAGSKVEMDALDWHRMSINNGSVVVSGGALLDAAVNPAACANGRWCGVFIANNAGDTGTFTVTGAGSKARFVSNVNVGQSYVTAPPGTPWTLGEPGGSSLAQVNVLAGGRLETEQVYVAEGPSGPASTGSESVVAQIRVKGAGSVWSVTGGNGRAGSFMSGMGAAANTLADIQITDGGLMQLSADANTAAFVQLGFNGGVHRMAISGAGSKLSYGTTSNAGLWIGRNGATASLSVANGGAIEGVNRIQVGNTGAAGTLTVAGSGSRIDYGSRFADLYVGRQGGTGALAITQGATVSLDAFLPRLYVGSGDGAAGTSGVLRLDGSGSLLSLVSPQSAAGTFDLPQANIGWGGTGTVDVTGGAVLSLNGRGTSTPAQVAQTRLTLGQNIGGLNGTGTLNVSGAGSLVSVVGTDAVVFVGRNTGSTGALNLAAGAALQTTLLDVGVSGGVGTLQANAASITLNGQHSGNPIGATLGIGLGTGSLGSVRLANGSTLTIDNAGDQGSLLLIGGSNSAPGGNGSLVVRASTVQVSGQPFVSGAVIGYNGSGLASFETGSLLDVGTHGIVVGWKPGSTGVFNVSGGSSVQAGYVGVGTSRDGDGGVATLIVNDTSTLTAGTIEIGAKGYVGGTGTLAGNIINRGTFNPGNSPGTLSLQGSFENQAGGRLVLEVEADGHGGFVTDQLVFNAGSSVNLSGVQIEFRFLGATDPNAFQASGGFQIDSFLRQGATALNHGLLGSASYSASSSAYQFTSFTFSTDGGAVFQAQAVPEPGTWMLFAVGLLLGAWLQRQHAREA